MATPLSPEAVNSLMSRVPPLKSPSPDRQAFALREGSKPVPPTAKTISLSFPAHQQRSLPDNKNQPVQIASAAPKRDVEVAPQLTVSFNQAMVPIATVEQLEAKDPPIHISPQPPAQWRWLGTQTLLFAAKVRFPMATDYHVEIPAGISSVSGQKLASAQSFSFITPTVKLESHLPGEVAQPLKPLIFLKFNQDIDPAAALATVKVSAGKVSAGERGRNQRRQAAARDGRGFGQTALAGAGGEGAVDKRSNAFVGKAQHNAAAQANERVDWKHPDKALKNLTQIDSQSDTKYDEDRCGAATLLAGSLLQGPKAFAQGLDQVLNRASGVQALYDNLPGGQGQVYSLALDEFSACAACFRDLCLTDPLQAKVLALEANDELVDREIIEESWQV